MTNIKILFITLFAATLVGCSYSEKQKVTTFTNLVMEDNFDVDGTLNSAYWTYDIGRGGNGWGNNELQYYTDRSDNVSVQNGKLIITAQKEDYEGASYTSARIKTQGLVEQKYGRFEARMRLPSGQGMWPAFWMLGNDINSVGWPECGEIDIMEYRGQEPTIIHGSIHGPGYSAGQAVTKAYDLDNDRFDTGFHVFGIEWGPEYINYYVDDILYNQITPDDVDGKWVFDHPFFIVINLAVGGNYVGSPDGHTQFPQHLVIDYVKVYSK